MDSIENSESLVERAQTINPRTAVCFNGHYGEDFRLGDGGEMQRQVSRALVWSDGDDCIPDWAMREAWPELDQDWERLQVVAWERHPMHRQLPREPTEVETILALRPSSDVLIRALYWTLDVESRHDVEP